ncbi:plasma glutamate carboxypeptidase [Capsaspora owczarzaki ATCC 30864]|uniref:plasma glutamate carboxypeptidase n=1 Tax=Capsaspora owczarzaki (strain ATCC 30864) TaxID=595528 RepID=UPI0001FE4658|nr:plasma glutamate carboxypeptidase [Capsaspora owczarzaki ATCC 30864]|eukprot:XP_004343354.1 plasma glutamate carboxypeptidase [Capsaspora owczarzaki ATCC 30864]
MRSVAALLLLLLCASVATACSGDRDPNPNAKPLPPSSYVLPERIVQQIRDHQDDANRIIDYFTKGPGQGQTYTRLASLVDTVGPRPSGSASLERAIDMMLGNLKADRLDNVHGEPAWIPHWVRGAEYVQLLEPHDFTMNILSLGSSVGTGPQGITAEAIVVSSFEELTNRSAEAKGKIVVFNQPFVSYGETSVYRTQGASAAAKVGGVASLIRTIAPFSIYSPHTGVQFYTDGIPKIPTACITIEDAEMMARMHARGQRIVLKVYLEAQNLNDTLSRNTVAEVVGSTHPEQVVLVSGHLDSWDIAEAAMDDAGGAIISWQALSVVKALGLKPKRTMRALLWTSEEFGGVGSQQYYNSQANNTGNYSIVMESDLGTFTPTGLEFTGSPAATAIIQQIGQLLVNANATGVFPDGEGTDIAPFMNAGVPGASLHNDNDDYFYFHHSRGDTMTVEDPVALDLCAAVWAVYAYVIADLDDMLPR